MGNKYNVILKGFLLIISVGLFILPCELKAQCSSTTLVTAQNADNSGSTLSLNLGKLNGNYEQVNNAIVGMAYKVSSSSGGAYFTIKTVSAGAGGTVITSGTQPVSFTATATTVYIIINSSAACATSAAGNPNNTLIAAPSINSIPANGCTGNSIIISGNGGFTGATAVSFNGTNAPTFTVNSSTSITVTVPSGATTGTVSVTGSGGTGTSGSSITIFTSPTATTSNSGPYCSYGTITLTGGPAAMSSYSWSGPTSFTSSLQSPTRSASGNGGSYALTVTDGNGCTSSASTSVTVNVPATATATNTGPYCSYGTIALTGGPAAMTTYSWTGPNTFTSSLQSPTRAANNNGGSYALTVTDSHGCTSTASTSVTVNVPPNSTPSNAGPYCSYQTIALTGNPAAMTTYSWAGPNAFTSTLQNPTRAASSNGGSYTLKVTDSHGCTSSASTLVTVNAPATATTSSSGPYCSYGTITLTGGPAAMVSYSWTGPNTFTSTLQSPTNSASGNGGSYALTVTDDNGCTSSASTSVTVNVPATATATNTGPYCSYSTIALTGGPAAMTTYSWTGPNTFTSSLQSPTRAANNNGGSYTIIVTDSHGCTSTTSTSVTVNIPPTSAPSNAGPYCSYQTIALTGNPAAMTTYSWTGPNAFTSTLQNPIRAASSNGGSYTLTVTDSHGCTSSANTPVTVNVPATAAPSNSGPYCSYGTITLTGGPAAISSYSWSGPTSFTSSLQSPTRSASGNGGSYALTVTDGNGCTSSASTSVTVNVPPTATATNTGPYCSYNTMTLTGGPAAMTTYSWTGPNTFTSSLQSPTRAANNNGGGYTLIVTDSHGCTSTASTTVTVNAAPIDNAGADQGICKGSNTTLGAASTAGDTYSWSPSTTLNSSTLSNPTASPTASTTYTLTENITSTGCTAINSVVVTVNAVPIATTTNGSQTICSGAAFTTKTLSTSNGVTGTTFAWTRDSTSAVTGIAASGSGTSITGVTLTNTTTSPVTVTFTITPTGPGPTFCVGNNITATVTVNPTTKITAQPSGVTVCSPNPINLSVVATGLSITYQWKFNSGNIIGATNSGYTVASSSSANTGSYTVVVTGTCGTSTSSTASVTVNVAPTITTQPAGDSVCLGSPLNLSVVASGTPLNYQWQKGSSNITGATNSTYTVANSGSSDAGNYNVVVSNSCNTTTSNIVAISITSAVTIPYVEDFESITVPNQFPDCLTSTNPGSKTFTRVNGTKPRSGNNYGSFGNNANDWFFLPGINLVGGIAYELSFWYNTDNTSPATSMQGAVGTEPSPAFMTTLVGPALSGASLGAVNVYHQYIIVYTPTVSGVYFFGTHVTTNPGATADKVTIDDIGMLFECNGTPTAGTAAVSTSLVCSGSTTNLSLTGYTTGVGGIGFQWQSSPAGAGTWSNISGATTPSYVAAVNVNSDYRCVVTCTHTGQNDISNTVTVNVNFISTNPVSATSLSSLVCLGDSTTLILNGGGGGTGEVIKWYISSCGGTLVGAGNNLKVSIDSVTTFYGRYEDGAPCNYNSACASVTVNTKSLPPLAVNPPDAVCTGNTISVLTASGATTYSWLPTTNLTPGAGTSATETVQISALTIYTVTGTGSNGCTINTQVPVATVAVGGFASPTYSIICNGGTKTLTVTGAAGHNYQWQISADNSIWSNISGATNTIYTTSSSSGLSNKYYRLVAKSNACWDVASTTAEVDVSHPVIALSAIGTTDNSLTLNWSPIGTGNYSISYSGTSSGTQTSITPAKTITGLTANGTYNITVTQTGIAGCTASGTLAGVNTLCAMPTGVILSSPAAARILVSWTGVPGANYRVYYRPLFAFGYYFTKDVSGVSSALVTKQGNNNLYGSTTYEVYVSRLDCPTTGAVGQGTNPTNATTLPTVTCNTPVIDSVRSLCPVQIEVFIHPGSSPTGSYNIYLQRITPTILAVNSYGVTGNYFTINVPYSGDVYLIAADSKCTGGALSSLFVWPGNLTVKPLCAAPNNLILSNPTCHGFTASWNADQCLSNSASGYNIYLRMVGTLNYNSYGVSLPLAPIGPNKIVGWLTAGRNYQVFVRSVYNCNGFVTYGPSSQTQTIASLSGGCRDEDTEQSREIKPEVQRYSADEQEVFSLYPNPSNGVFAIDMSSLSNEVEGVRIEVINMMGQTIVTHLTTISGGHMSEFINLPNGTASGSYIIRLTAGKNVYTAKINVSK